MLQRTNPITSNFYDEKQSAITYKNATMNMMKYRPLRLRYCGKKQTFSNYANGWNKYQISQSRERCCQT